MTIMNNNKVLICPNCKRNNFKHEWVLKSKKEELEEINLDEYAVDLMKAKKAIQPFTLTSSSGTLTWGNDPINELKDCIQLKVICNNCGYTRVYDTDKYNVADEL